MTLAKLEEHVIESIERDREAVIERLVRGVDSDRLIARSVEGQLVPPLRHAATAELHAGMRGWRLGRCVPAEPPAETGEFARRSARQDLPLANLMRIYHVALTVYWEAIYDAILGSAAARDVQRDLTRTGTAFLHRFMAQVSALAADEHTDERGRALRRRTLRRLATVRDVLAGTTSSSTTLGYDLRRHHLGVVATGAGAEELLAQAAQHSKVDMLAVPEDEIVWAWFGSNRRPVLIDTAETLGATTRSDVRIGIGRPQVGVEGFRVTHHQATAAHGLAVTMRASLLSHGQIALEHLAGGDSAIAGQFIRDELGPIRDDRQLRTLREYLDAGQNGTRAAAGLGVSARTVSHRLRLIEDRLGHDIAARAAELQVALRLRELADRTRTRFPDS